MKTSLGHSRRARCGHIPSKNNEKSITGSKTALFQQPALPQHSRWMDLSEATARHASHDDTRTPAPTLGPLIHRDGLDRGVKMSDTHPLTHSPLYAHTYVDGHAHGHVDVQAGRHARTHTHAQTHNCI